MLRFASAERVRAGDRTLKEVDAKEFASEAAGAQCPRAVYIERATHDRLAAVTLNKGYEVGGPLMLHVQGDGSIELVADEELETTEKKHARVTIPRSLVEFHTHPATCARGRCVVALPSAQDMVNILFGAIYGVQAHVVYCEDGVYTIQLAEWLRQQVEGARPTAETILKIQRIACEMFETLDGMFNAYDEAQAATHSAKVDKSLYANYQQQWLKAVRDRGFEVTLTPPHSEPPPIKIKAPCSLEPHRTITPLVRIDMEALGAVDGELGHTCPYVHGQLGRPPPPPKNVRNFTSFSS